MKTELKFLQEAEREVKRASEWFREFEQISENEPGLFVDTINILQSRLQLAMLRLETAKGIAMKKL